MSRGSGCPTPRRVVGIVSASDLVRGERQTLTADTARLPARSGNAVPAEARVTPGTSSAGQAVREMPSPPGTIVLSVARGQALVSAGTAPVLEPGDLVSALVHPSAPTPGAVMSGSDGGAAGR